MSLVVAVIREVEASYDVVARKRIIRSTTPTPLNSAVARGQYRSTPDSVDGLRSKTMRETEFLCAWQWAKFPSFCVGYMLRFE